MNPYSMIISPSKLAGLLSLIEDGTVTRTNAKEVMKIMIDDRVEQLLSGLHEIL